MKAFQINDAQIIAALDEKQARRYCKKEEYYIDENLFMELDPNIEIDCIHTDEPEIPVKIKVSSLLKSAKEVGIILDEYS